MDIGKKLAIAAVALAVGIQFIPVSRENPAAAADLEIEAPAHVMGIFKRACYDCHSNQTDWPWYSRVAPVSWFVSQHVNDGREWLNFSAWKGYDAVKKAKSRIEIYRSISHAMPLGSYVRLHPDAKLNSEDKAAIRAWTGVTPGDLIRPTKGQGRF